ncbi:MAG: helix-turn-helix transcriptional regulator [Parcubacteria group bacterium]|nr:helix-turn-helix transcriptional regulator [Parcubacteria group bacterium]
MDSNTRKKIGENIKARREQLGLSQEELAKSVGKQTATYIAFIEKGERNITTVDLMAIAKQLGITVANLVGEEKKQSGLTFREVLRASKDLSKSDRNKMEDYYDYIKKKK